MARRRLESDTIYHFNRFAGGPGVYDALETCFSGDILPNRLSHPKFRPIEIDPPLYERIRDWKDSPGLEHLYGDAHGHERYLDDIFWKRDERSPWLIILGDVGSGKSTLVDYYLRCYCPYEGSRTEDFSKKLVLWFDPGTIDDPAQVFGVFYNDLKKQIQKRVKEAGGPDLNSVLSGKTQDVRLWVMEALDLITSQQQNNTFYPFSYVIVCLDNLDQASVKVQNYLVNEVAAWIKQGINIFRVIVPLWPSTYFGLRSSLTNVIRKAADFRVGPVPVKTLLANRKKAVDLIFVQASIKKLSLPGESRHFFSEALNVADTNLGTLVGRLSNGDMRRRQLWLLDFISSRKLDMRLSLDASLDDAIHHLHNLSLYDLTDAMLTGVNDLLTPETREIANVFDLGHARSTARDLLIGVHALTFLAGGPESADAGAFRAHFKHLGYRDDNIDWVRRNLRKYNCIHEEVGIPAETGSRELPVVMKPHGAVISQYLDLCEDPAYLDNIAMITPVDEKFAERIKRTLGGGSGDFKARVQSTISFIEFLDKNEREFCNSLNSSGSFGTEYLRNAGFPRFAKRAWIGYRRRLNALHKKGFLDAVEPEWWSDVLNSSTMSHIEKSSDFLP